MAVVLTIQDLLPFAPAITVGQADALISGTVARAAVHAPCLLDDAFPSGAALDLLRDVVLRRFRDAGGRLSQSTVGSVTLQYDYRTVEKAEGIFTASEVAELQQMCRNYAGLTSPKGLPVYSMPDPPTTEWPDPVRETRWIFPSTF